MCPGNRARYTDNKLIAIGSEDAFTLGVLSSRIHVAWALRAGGWLGVGNDPVYVKTRCFDPFPCPTASEPQAERIRAIAEELDAHRKRVLAEHPQLTLTGLYNVLEKLRAGTAPDDLAPAERRIFDDGLVLILKELLDRLDAAVSAAYGWPADLSETEILTRLVALNKERAAKEANGTVRWLRPDYQIPRFGSAADKAKLNLQGGAMRAAAPEPAGAKPSFPKDDRAQGAAVTMVLATASGPMNDEAVAACFKQGRRILPQVRSVLASFARLAYVSTNDGGRSFSLRRAS